MQIEDLIREGSNWEVLPGELSSLARAGYLEQYRQLMSSKEAREVKEVAYIFAVEKAIPRVLEHSNITYIGKTVQTFYRRYYDRAEEVCSEELWKKLRTLAEKYGPCKLYYLRCRNPEEEEEKLLGRYFKEHCECPPENHKSR